MEASNITTVDTSSTSLLTTIAKEEVIAMLEKAAELLIASIAQAKDMSAVIGVSRPGSNPPDYVNGRLGEWGNTRVSELEHQYDLARYYIHHYDELNNENPTTPAEVENPAVEQPKHSQKSSQHQCAKMVAMNGAMNSKQPRHGGWGGGGWRGSSY